MLLKLQETQTKCQMSCVFFKRNTACLIVNWTPIFLWFWWNFYLCQDQGQEKMILLHDHTCGQSNVYQFAYALIYPIKREHKIIESWHFRIEKILRDNQVHPICFRLDLSYRKLNPRAIKWPAKGYPDY